MNTIDPSAIEKHLLEIRSTNPLIHNITNYVAMTQTANALLALGASPIMAHAPEEVGEISALSSALVLNIGTLSVSWLEGMNMALASAQKSSVPVVLDPVGAGATNFRTKWSNQFLSSGAICVLRGNASEIAALSGDLVEHRGVDSSLNSLAVSDRAVNLAKKHGCIVVMSGEIDFITDGEQSCQIANGHKIMSRVTGMGCTASAVVAAFIGQSGSGSFESAVCAMAVMGICGEMAYQKANGLGDFPAEFLTALDTISPKDLTSLKIHDQCQN